MFQRHPIARILCGTLFSLATTQILTSCDAGYDHSSTNQVAPTVQLRMPTALRQIRAVPVESLFAEVTVSYTTESGTVTLPAQIASAGTDDPVLRTRIDVPANVPFNVQVIWFDSAGESRLDLVQASRDVSAISPGNSVSVSLDFDEQDSDQFDFDEDGFTNLTERLEDTSPFDASDTPDSSVPSEDDPVRPADPVPADSFIVSAGTMERAAVYFADNAPAPGNELQLNDLGDEQTSTIIGGSVSLNLSAAQPFRDVFIQASPFDGYFQLSLDRDQQDISLILNVTADSNVDEEGENIRILVRDVNGLTSNEINARVVPLIVGTGDVQVSVRWDTASDVDLYVTEPDGTIISFGNRQSASGGALDLDSNPGCNFDNVNNENVTYQGVQAPAGEYVVEIDYWSACDVSGPTNYVVTVRSNGVTSNFTGTFTAADVNGTGIRTEVTRFIH